MIFYVEISVIFRVCENALYGLVMNCLKKMFSNQKTLKKVLDIVDFFGKIHVCLECSSKWTRNYKQKRLAGSV